MLDHGMLSAVWGGGGGKTSFQLEKYSYLALPIMKCRSQEYVKKQALVSVHSLPLRVKILKASTSGHARDVYAE